MLWKLIWKRKLQFILSLVCIGAASGLLILIPKWVKTFFYEVLTNKNLSLIQNHLLSGIILIIFIQFFLFGKDFLRLRLSHRIVSDIRSQLFSQVITLPLGSVQEFRRGDLISRLSNDLIVLQNGLMRGIFRFVPNTIMLIIILILMLTYSLVLTVITIFLILPMGWVVGFFVKKIQSRTKRAQEQMASLNNLVEESLGGIREIKSYGQEKQIKSRFNSVNQSVLKSNINLDWFSALNPAIVLIVTTIGVSVMIFISAWLVIEKILLMENLIAFLSCLALAFSPVQEISGSLGFISRISAVMNRIEGILKIKPENVDEKKYPPLPKIKGAIKFHEVCFSYDNRFKFDNIDFIISAGETIAIVGPSGAGKTTIINLIARFLDPESGIIRIDNMDIQKYRIDSLRKQIGLVSQEPVLFDGTLKENLSFSSPGVSWEKIWSAAKKAHVEEFAQKLPERYDTQVGPYGCKLSAGQRQRVSIARAFLLNSRILILDEPTASLDTESEYLIQDSLKSLCQNRTTLIIAHRLSTIRYADRIIVINNGRVEEIGTHSQLLQKKGLYSRLYSFHFF
jgi:subfamily B ATP-binding cassette protein MsbA